MTRRGTTRSIAAIGALALVTLAGALPANAKDDPKADRPTPPGLLVNVDIAAITDFHGQLKTVTDSAGVVTNGGASGVSGVVRSLQRVNPRTIIVSNGDSVGGSAYESAVLEDVPTIEFLNAMKLDVSNSGNHEFDQGWTDLRGRIMELADFNFLAANLTGTPALRPYEIVKMSGGVTVAFVGTLTEELPSIVNPEGIAGITVGDPCAATNAYAAQLSDGRASNGEANIVVALSHAGRAQISQCGFNQHVDAVFTGHTHDPFVGTVTRADDVQIPIIEGASSGKAVGHVSLTYDRRLGTIAYKAAENIATAGYVDGASVKVKRIVQQALLDSAEAGKAVVGAVSDDLLRPHDGTRGNESAIGDVLGNVALWQGDQITDADIGVINAGGIRADIAYAGDTAGNPLNVDGAVTYAEAFTVQPFGNTMAYIDLTGAQVDKMLEQQWQDGKSRPVLRLGISTNVSYAFDPARAQGDRVTDVQIDGVPIDPAATYTVAGNAFLLSGGDSFTVFDEAEASFVDTGIIDLQSLLDYFKVNSPVAPDYGQNSVGLTLSGPLTAGTAVTASLTSLALSNFPGEPAPETVELYVDGTLVGQADVDNEVDIDTADDAEARTLVDLTGQATITFTVPDDVSADPVITVVVDGTAVMSF